MGAYIVDKKDNVLCTGKNITMENDMSAILKERNKVAMPTISLDTRKHMFAKDMSEEKRNSQLEAIRKKMGVALKEDNKIGYDPTKPHRIPCDQRTEMHPSEIEDWLINLMDEETEELRAKLNNK